MRRWGVVCLALWAASGAPAFAGPCSAGIYSAQVDFDNRLHVGAAKGPAAPQSTAATLHRQPTPKSLAAAEAQLGDISEADARDFGADRRRARAADAANDKAACESALKDARAILGR